MCYPQTLLSQLRTKMALFPCDNSIKDYSLWQCLRVTMPAMKQSCWLLLFAISCGPAGTSAFVQSDAAVASPDAVVQQDAPPPNPLPVTAMITADNAYGFGYGSANSLNNYFGGIENTDPCDIFCANRGAETYIVPKESANSGNFLYLIVWSDNSATNGVIGSFTRGDDTINTASDDWQVCATGMPDNYRSGGPSFAEIQTGLVACSKGDATTVSHGWRTVTPSAHGNVAIGELNDNAGGIFPLVVDLAADLRWMWYQHQDDSRPFNTTTEDTVDSEFLLFRLPIASFPTIE